MKKFICIFLSLILLSPLTASAAGFYLSEVGTPVSLGTGGVANPTNRFSADAAWTNPAGMTGLEKDSMLSGFQLLLPLIEFEPEIATGGGDDGGNAGKIVAIPSFFYVKKINDRVRLGISMTGAIGGGVDYGSTFAGRYSTSKAELAAIGISPSLAFKVNDKLSVGAGVSLLYTIFEQDIVLNPAVVPGGTITGGDGMLSVEDADGFGFQPYFGLQYALTERALLGVVYRAEADIDLDGDVAVENLVAPIGVNSVDIEWDNPQWLEVGLSYKLSDTNIIILNGGWQDWSAFSKNTLAFSGGLASPVAEIDRDFDDTWHAGIAFAHINEDAGKGYSVGFSYESSPVSDSNRTFDLPFEEYFKFSGAYAWKGKNKDFSVGGTLIMLGDAAIDQTSQGVRVKGEFDNNLILMLGVTMKWK